jgi:hypothetical protein
MPFRNTALRFRPCLGESLRRQVRFSDLFSDHPIPNLMSQFAISSWQMEFPNRFCFEHTAKSDNCERLKFRYPFGILNNFIEFDNFVYINISAPLVLKVDRNILCPLYFLRTQTFCCKLHYFLVSHGCLQF